MQADFLQIAAFLIAAMVLFAVYRCFRRNFGQQPLRPIHLPTRVYCYSVVLGKSKRAQSRRGLPKRDDYRVSNQQERDHQSAVAPSRYQFNHDRFSTFVAA